MMLLLHEELTDGCRTVKIDQQFGSLNKVCVSDVGCMKMRDTSPTSQQLLCSLQCISGFVMYADLSTAQTQQDLCHQRLHLEQRIGARKKNYPAER